jgi:hypothetical protein
MRPGVQERPDAIGQADALDAWRGGGPTATVNAPIAR